MEVSDSPSPPDAPPEEPVTAAGSEALLWRALKRGGSSGAREALFTLHLPFARRIAARYFQRGRAGQIEYADLTQWAFAGLLEAIDHFDPNREISFRTYSARRISGSILDGVAKTSDMRGQVSFRNRVRRERTRSLLASGEQMQRDKDSQSEALSALTDLAVGLAVGFMLDGTGLYMNADTQDPGANAYESLHWKDTVRAILAEVESLPERERLIIRHHYLNGLSFDKIGEVLHLTKGRVSQIHRAAIMTLRKRVGRKDDFKLAR